MKTEFIRNNIKLMERIKKEISSKDGKLFNLMISGSYLYGFESKDSDTDYRGTYVLNSNKLLGLFKPKKVIELSKDNDDIVLFELSKEISLALKGNCNSLERINATQLFNDCRFLELKRLLNNIISKNGIYNSYKGMAIFNYKKFILSGKQNTKKYLYVFRALMGGIYVLQTGRIEPNINVLNKYFKLDSVKKLVKIKKENKEKDQLPEELRNGSLEKEIDILLDRLDTAYVKSKIPEEPDESDINKVNSYLLKIRKNSFW